MKPTPKQEAEIEEACTNQVAEPNWMEKAAFYQGALWGLKRIEELVRDQQRLDRLEEQGGFHMAQRALDAAWRRKEDNPYQLTPTVRRAIDETMMR